MKDYALPKLLGLGLVLVLAAVAGATLQAEESAPASSEVKPTLVLNITSGKDDKHAVTMAYALAGHALDDGRRVALFFNVRGPQVASKHIAGARFQSHPPLEQMLAKLIERGAEALVCPMCAEALSVSGDQLLPGVQFATRASLFANLGPNSHVFTY